LSGYRQLSVDPPRVLVFGATNEELFENAAFAMFDQAYEIGVLAPTYSRPVVAPGDTVEALLANWLDELLFISEQERLVWSSFVVDRLEEGGVQGSASGMPIDEAGLRPRMITGLAEPAPAPVPVPDGWWIELAFAAVPRIGK
jgi:SHS2 domain-containing protein